MSGDTIGKTSKAEPGTDRQRLPRITDEEFWKAARVMMPRPKKMVTMRLDADLLAWFRRKPGCQTRINAILRAYMNARAEGCAF